MGKKKCNSKKAHMKSYEQLQKERIERIRNKIKKQRSGLVAAIKKT
ncbi:hypothetical protein SMSP1_01508 [Sedimentisphaera salicampi]|nr:hypothetical protein SMSP1_01508 [Sedimentisphaera salicampi]